MLKISFIFLGLLVGQYCFSGIDFSRALVSLMKSDDVGLVVRFLDEHPDLENIHDSEGNNVAHYFLKHERLDLLLARPCFIELVQYQNTNRETVLHYLARHNRHEELALLLERIQGVAPEIMPNLLALKNKSGDTALHHAAFFVAPESIVILRQEGASCDDLNNYHRRPVDRLSRQIIFPLVAHMQQAAQASEDMNARLNRAYQCYDLLVD